MLRDRFERWLPALALLVGGIALAADVFADASPMSVAQAVVGARS